MLVEMRGDICLIVMLLKGVGGGRKERACFGFVEEVRVCLAEALSHKPRRWGASCLSAFSSPAFLTLESWSRGVVLAPSSDASPDLAATFASLSPFLSLPSSLLLSPSLALFPFLSSSLSPSPSPSLSSAPSPDLSPSRPDLQSRLFHPMPISPHGRCCLFTLVVRNYRAIRRSETT
jgi:hypothetical protein